MRTFSEIVDTVVAAVGQPHLLLMVAAETNAVIHDLQTNHLSPYDLAEHRLAGVRGTVKWTLPVDFRSMKAVRYAGHHFIPMVEPSLKQNKMHRYWYQSGDTIVFINADHFIDIAYYTSRKIFKYVKVNMRKLRSSDQTEYDFDYRSDVEAGEWTRYNANSSHQKRSYDAHVNWVIHHYPEAIMHGVLASIHNHLGQTDRGGRAYQAYTRSKAIIERNQGVHLNAQL